MPRSLADCRAAGVCAGAVAGRRSPGPPSRRADVWTRRLRVRQSTRRKVIAAQLFCWAVCLRCGAAVNAAGWEGGADVELFWEQGFLRIPGFASAAEVAELRRSMDGLLAEWARSHSSDASSVRTAGGKTSSGMAAADSGNDTQGRATLSSLRTGKPDHSFLLESANKASFFLEPGAVDSRGSLLPGVDPRYAVRKVAHGLHLLEGAVRTFVRSPKIAHLARELGWQRPTVVQTLYRAAPPGAAGVDRHQDSVTLFTEPPSCLGLWLALEDADESNGCLRVNKGSHRGPLRERLVRRGCSGRSEAHRDEHCTPSLVFEKLSNATLVPNSAFTPMLVVAGDLLVMHGTTEHFSEAGQDPSRSRESLQFHLVEASAIWPSDNWLQYPPGQAFEELQGEGAAGSEAAAATARGSSAAFESTVRGTEL